MLLPQVVVPEDPLVPFLVNLVLEAGLANLQKVKVFEPLLGAIAQVRAHRAMLNTSVIPGRWSSPPSF